MTSRSGLCLRPWQPPSPEPECGQSDIHVWRASLGWSLERIERLAEFLSDDERTRGERFLFLRDRQRYIEGRGLLRVILSRYLDTSPAKLSFIYSDYGKPSLVGKFRSLRFNVSHSDQLALYSVSRGRETGIDVERIRPQVLSDAAAGYLLGPQELVMLRQRTPQERLETVFAAWTRKEATLKARGVGLSELTADVRPSLRLAVEMLQPAPGYVGALAIEGHDYDVNLWEWCE